MSIIRLWSHNAKEFLAQARAILKRISGNSSPAGNIGASIAYTDVEMYGTWIPRGKVGIATIYFTRRINGKVIIYDWTVDYKLTRFLRASGITNEAIFVMGAPKAVTANYLIVKETLLDYLAIENLQINGEETISTREWKILHKRAVTVGAFDVAAIAFKQLLMRQLGYSAAKKIIQERYDRWLVYDAPNMIEVGGDEDDD